MYTNIIGKFLSTAMVLHDFACPHKLHNLLCIIFFTRLVRKIIIHHTTMNYIFKWSGTLAAMYSPRFFLLFFEFSSLRKKSWQLERSICLTLPRIKCTNGEGFDGVEIGFPKFKLLCWVVFVCIMYMAGYYLKVSKKF